MAVWSAKPARDRPPAEVAAVRHPVAVAVRPPVAPTTNAAKPVTAAAVAPDNAARRERDHPAAAAAIPVMDPDPMAAAVPSGGRSVAVPLRDRLDDATRQTRQRSHR